MQRPDVSGVHVNYLHHCHRQLWLFLRGIRSEHLSERVRFGEALHDRAYGRFHPVDLGAARLDHLDGDLWVHEVKSSDHPTATDEAQAMYCCLRLHEVGVEARGAVLHYWPMRRNVRVAFDGARRAAAEADITAVLDVAGRSVNPDRLPRQRCAGCSFTDYCWTE